MDKHTIPDYNKLMRKFDDDTNNLLETKLEIPLLNRRIVSRQRLTMMLDQGVRRHLSLVIAPTGYGKTTLLVEWVLHGANANSRIAWVNLDSYNNPPLRFWAYVVHGIRKAIPDLQYDLAEYVQLGYNEKNFKILNPLLNEIGSIQEQIILILDDFHTITDPVVNQGLMYLIEHKPHNLHVVIAGRKMPDLPLSRLIAQDQVTQITQENLVFTFCEVESFLNRVMDLDASQEQVARLLESSEGWIAGIQLAGLSHHSWSEFDLIKDQFSNDNRQVYAYLSQEVLNAQEQDLRDFLIKTSILEELSAPLCDDVLQRTDSRGFLDKIEEANLFLVCVDYPGCGFRYHSLFAEMLQEVLLATYPEEVSELHRRACSWMLEHEMPEKAISHAIAAGDLEWAAEILDQYAVQALMRHDIFNLARWIDYFPDELFIRHPQMWIYSAFVNYHLGRIEDVRDDLGQVEHLINSPASGQYFSEEKELIRWEHDAMQAMLHTTTDDFTEAIESIHTVLESPPQAALYFIISLQHTLAFAYEKVGDLSGASRFFTKSYEIAVDQKNYLSQLRNLVEISRLEKIKGDLNQSVKFLNQCYQLCRQQNLDASHTIFVESALLERRLEKCEFSEAKELTDKIVTSLVEIMDNPKLWLSMDLLYSTVVEYYLAIHDRENLERYFDQMLKYTPAIRGDFPDMPWNLIDTQVRGWLALEETPVTSLHLNEIKTNLMKKRFKMLEEKIALNRILLAQGLWDDAQAGLEDLVNQLASSQLQEYWLQALVLLALVYWKQGLETSAYQALQTAMAYGLSVGYQLVFVREGGVMREMLRGYIDQDQVVKDQEMLKPYIQDLLELIEELQSGQIISEIAGDDVLDASGMGDDLLSKREIEVLHLLADGKAYKEIALSLNISLNTVKAHVKHIYSKLDVNSRMEMYARSRELNLMD